MSTSTTRLNATKPASSENVNVTVLNDNFDLFDGAVGTSVGTSAARPASAFSGRLWYTTDTTKLYVNTASTASAVASWADPVANALLSNVTVGGSLSASAGSVDITRSASASNAFTATVSADTQKRLAVTAGGVLNWSSGSVAADTNLYRSTTDTLKTDDSLIVGGTATVNSTLTASSNVNVAGSLAVTGGITATAKGYRTYLRKASTESLISNSTLQDDNDITFALAASAVYRVQLYASASGPAAGDIKLAWNVTGAASGGSHTARMCIGPGTTAGDVTVSSAVRTSRQSLATATTYGTDGSGTSSAIYEDFLLDTSTGTGTCTLQWAQNSSTATSTNMTTSTYAIVERLT